MNAICFSFCSFCLMAATADDFRGAWIASVHNINFPSSEGLSADVQKAQIVRLLDAAKRCRQCFDAPGTA
jgi:hypothetical protein